MVWTPPAGVTPVDRKPPSSPTYADIPAVLDWLRISYGGHTVVGLLITDRATGSTYRVDAEPAYGTPGTLSNYTLTATNIGMSDLLTSIGMTAGNASGQARLYRGRTYYWDAASTRTADGYAVIQAATGGAGRWIISDMEWGLNLRWFGLEEGGDAYQPFQRALAVAGDKWSIIVPPGNFTLSQPVTLPNTARPILGAGINTTAIVATAAMPYMLAKLGDVRTEGIEVRGLTLDAAKKADIGLKILSGKGAKIERVYVVDPLVCGLEFGGGTTQFYEANITQNRVYLRTENWPDPSVRPAYGMRLLANATDNDVYNNKIANVKTACIYDQGQNNNFTHNHVYGYPLTFAPQYGVIAEGQASYVQNYFDTCADAGIYIKNQNVQVLGNRFYWLELATGAKPVKADSGLSNINIIGNAAYGTFDFGQFVQALGSQPRWIMYGNTPEFSGNRLGTGLLLSHEYTSTPGITFSMNASSNSKYGNIVFQTNYSNRWEVKKGTGSAENLEILRYNDSGTFVDVPLRLVRSSGDVEMLSGAVKTKGGWATPLYLGNYTLWVDGTGKLRVKSGAPTSDTDGTVVGTQT